MTSVNFAQPDVTLRLDHAGVIREASLSSTIADEGLEGWVGRPWADTVGAGGNALVRQMLEAARITGVSSFHQVRQVFPSGLELPVEYATVRLGADAGLIAIGRSLEAVSDLRARLLADQTSMERDAWKLREVETRYRLLFETAAQPALLIAADDARVLEANPAAVRALGVTRERALVTEILGEQREAFQAMLARVRDQGKAPGIVLHLGADRAGWLVRASLMDAESTAVFVLQLSPSATRLAADVGDDARVDERAANIRLEDVIARLPEAFVVLDRDARIRFANHAFVALVEQRTADTVLGEPLARWIPRAAIGTLLERARSKGPVRGFATALNKPGAAAMDIELTATGSSDGQPPYIGILLRRCAAADTKRMGKALLRELVQETVASVERSAIEAAAELARGGRGAAADVVAKRREALRTKLARAAADVGADDDSDPPRDA